MKVGIYLGRFPNSQGGMALYAQELVANIVQSLALTDDARVKFVFYGDRSIFSKRYLFELTSLGFPLQIERGFRQERQGTKCLIRILPSFMGRHFGYLLDQFLLMFMARVDNLDLVHAVANTGLVLLTKPQIITVHDLFQAWPIQLQSSWGASGCYQKEKIVFNRSQWRSLLKRTFYNWLFVRQFKLGRCFLFDATWVADESKRRYDVDERKCRVIPLGVDREFEEWLKKAANELGSLDKAGREWLQEKKIEPGYTLVLASVDPRKNTDRMLKAWLALPADARDMGLVVVLSDPRACQVIEDFRGGLPLQDQKNVRVLERLQRAEMPFAFRMAGTVAMATLGEGFGLPALEAAAVGAIVVSGPNEYLQSQECLQKRVVFCEPWNEEDICRCLKQSLSDYRQTDILGRQDSNLPRPLFLPRSMATAVGETVEVYKQICAALDKER